MWNWLKLRWLLLGDSAGLILAIPAAILFGGLLVWILPHTKDVGWNHYRLTATFDVDGRLVKASQVYAYKCNSQSERFPQATCRLRGEAMAIDLAERGKVFFIMNQWNADRTALAGKDYMISRLNLAAKADGRPTWNNLPALVRFADLKNPETVEFLNPQHLEDVYGEGAVLTRFEVSETTDTETTGAIKQILPWLDQLKDRSLGKGDAAGLHAFDFKWPPN